MRLKIEKMILDQFGEIKTTSQKLKYNIAIHLTSYSLRLPLAGDGGLREKLEEHTCCRMGETAREVNNGST